MTAQQIHNFCVQMSATCEKAAQEKHQVNVDIPMFAMMGEIAYQLALMNERSHIIVCVVSSEAVIAASEAKQTS